MNNWKEFPHTSVDVLRHGACLGGEIFRGSTDVELSEQGWAQMHEAVRDMNWDQIISSPLKRCRLFAEALAEQSSTPITVDERWREFNFGVWEGQLREKVWAESGDDVVQFFSDPASFTPKNGDSYQAVCERVNLAWEQIIQDHKNKRILLVIHGGIFRTLHAQLKSLPSHAFNSIEVPYACLSRWKQHQDAHRSRPMLSFHNRPNVLVNG